MTRLLAFALLLAACSGPVREVPFDDDIPEGGAVIYRANDSKYGFYGDPVRIVKVGDLCFTESYSTYSEGWVFRESGSCERSVEP